MIVSLKHSVLDEENGKISKSFCAVYWGFLKGKTTSTDVSYIYRIVNTRYLKQKPIIISTDKSVGEILDFDEAVGSRILGMAGENVLYFDENSENHRLRNIMKFEL